MQSIQALLVGGNVFPWHRLEELGPHVEAAIGEAASITATTDRDALLELDSGAYDVLVDYRSDSTVTVAQAAAVLEFVTDGGGYLGIHCAADLTSVHGGEGGLEERDEPIPELRDLLGGHFVGHPEQTTFGVEIVADHPVTAGVEDFAVFDEPYRIEHDPEAITVLARMDHPNDDVDPDEPMVDYPVVWVREHGQGRVCYSSLGHTVEAFEHEAHRRLLRNATRWVAGA